MGEAGEGQNITHSQKKMGEDSLKAFRDRFNIPISDDDIAAAPFYKFAEDSEEMIYMRNSREKLGGYMPVRSDTAEPLTMPTICLNLRLKPI
jgi:pyruvate dehydrogenase E1 component